MMKKSILGSILLAAVATWANAQVSNVTLSRNADTGLITASYTLDAPAVITADVRVGGVSQNLNATVAMAGDVNKLVTKVGERCTLTFRPTGLTDYVQGKSVSVAITAWATNAPPDWMVINLKDPYEVRYYTSSNAIPYGVQDPINKIHRLVMRKIPAKGVTWKMGSVDETGDWNENREKQHTVTFTADYYMAIYELTAGQLTTGYGYHGYLTDAANLKPVTRGYNNIRGSVANGIDWPTTQHAVLEDSDLDHFRKLTKIELDLPTDAQWEYACRAGEGAPLYNGTEGEDNLLKLGWFIKNANDSTHPVGEFPPNRWGLYDMYGNVMEWCLDWIDPLTPLSDGTNPEGVTTGTTRVMRGGSYTYSYWRCRSAFREAIEPQNAWANLGFRFVCPAQAVR